MLRFRLAPDNVKFGFMRFRRVSYPFSAILSVVSVVLFLTVGLNFGIDFSGGTLFEVRAKQGQADLTGLRALGDKLGLGDVEVQAFGGGGRHHARAPATGRRRRPAGGRGEGARRHRE